MKRIFLQSSVVTLLLLVGVNSFAAKTVSVDAQLLQEMKEVTAEAKELKEEVKTLKMEVNELKHNQKTKVVVVKHVAVVTPAPSVAVPVPPPVASPEFGINRFIHSVTVTTSPYFGVRTAYDASDLLYEYPTMNEDLLLLKQRQEFEHELNAVGGTLDNRAIVAISGAIEGQIMTDSSYGRLSQGDINLTTAELDISAMVSRWANTFFSLDYDGSPPTTGSRITNSRIFLNRGFLTLGNLDVFPVYATVGQMYVPFGRYSSLMLTTPLTKSMARINARAVVLGFYKQGFYAEAYGFQGDRTSGSNSLGKQGGGNLGYQTTIGSNSSINLGVGAVSNMADSEGMQANGLSPILPSLGPPVVFGQFAGFGNTPNGNRLVHDVPGIDGHVEYTIGFVQLMAEYIESMRSFSPFDMTYNGHAARVGALHTEIDFNMHWWGRPVSLGLVYGSTCQALALNLPQNTYAVVLSTSLWKNTMIGLEYRHDTNYGRTALLSTTGALLPVPSANIGGSRNMLTLQLGAYF